MNKAVVLMLLVVVCAACTQQLKPEFNSEHVLKELSISSDGKTEVVKNFPDNFPEVLIERGQPTLYTRENSNNFEYIGMPVGGIGTGMLYLGGDGQLWFWDIFNLNYRYGDLKGEEAYEFPYERSKVGENGTWDVNQGFAISVTTHKGNLTKKLNRDEIRNIEFLGQYPVSQVTYSDPELPVTVELEVYSPFIPQDIKNSMLPATVLNYTIKNTSEQSVEAELLGWLENVILMDSHKNNAIAKQATRKSNTLSKDGYLQLQCTLTYDESVADSIRKLPDYGSMTLSVLGSKNELYAHNDTLNTLGRKVTLAPKEEQTVSFVLTWHFANVRPFYNNWHKNKTESEKMYRFRNQYAVLFDDAIGVSDYLIHDFDKLGTQTKLWRDTWYNSTLPYWFLDRTFLNTSILASCTSRILEGWRFYGWEGSYQGEGTCNHVWGYVQTLARFFPELEQKLRTEVDFVPVEEGGAMNPQGDIAFRWRAGHGMAVDGQSGVILRTYLSHQYSKDNTFLEDAYPGIKKAMNGLIAINDADHDGILTGPQHNTLDASWYGKVTWLSLFYATALRATAEMAAEVGDTEYATFCIETADKGRKYIEANLFNGEYFIHEADSLHPESPGTYTGLEYSQLVGQNWAYQTGLGQVLDSAKVGKALESMWRYNFTTDVDAFRKAHPAGRWYAMPGEGGLIACTWPRGGSEVLDKGEPRYAAYNNECQNGYEYAATALMMRHGMPYHALSHVWYMDRNRYHGSKRNPYAEVEWGIHYARSMASFGHFTAASGFTHHGPKGYLEFAPQVTPHNFKSAFIAAGAYGTFEQIQYNNKQTNRISIASGAMNLRTLVLELNSGAGSKEVYALKNDTKVECNIEQKANKIIIHFADGTNLNTNEVLSLVIEY